MKIRIPEKLIKLAYNFVDFETSGDSSKPSIRMYEYSWVLGKLYSDVPAYSDVLDVGCTARMNMIPATICRYGWEVVGIDIRDYYYAHKNFKFYKINISELHKVLKREFNVVTAISSIEHFGLDLYGNGNLDIESGDIKAVNEIHKFLRPSGFLLMTVPYVQGKPYIMNKAARVYNWESLCRLLEGFKIIDTEEVTIGKETTIMVEAIKV